MTGLKLWCLSLYGRYVCSAALILCLIALSSRCHAAQDGLQLIRTFDLGGTSSGKLVADIKFRSDGSGSNQTVPSGEFFVVFKTVSNHPTGREKTVTMDTGPGFLDDSFTYAAEDYVNLGRKQIFISNIYGARSTHIFDYDGKKVRSLYLGAPGRVAVEPAKVSGRKWEMLEKWAAYQYNDDNLGVAFVTGTTEVTRPMVWKHGRFTPKYPGPTKIKQL